MTNENLTRIIQ